MQKTNDHVKLLNLLRQNVKDERVIQMIKRYLKSGVMEDGVVVRTTEGSPQGGNLSPLLANIYLNEFDQEFKRRGVPCIRYADDIVLLAKSERASQRLLESSVNYLEGALNLRVNREKSRTVSVIAIRNFKYLGFCLGKGKNGVFIRVHPKSYMKFKDKLRVLTSRSRWQYRKSHEADRDISTRMAELFWNSGHEELKPPCTERYARWCKRTAANHSLLLDLSYVILFTKGLTNLIRKFKITKL